MNSGSGGKGHDAKLKAQKRALGASQAPKRTCKICGKATTTDVARHLAKKHGITTRLARKRAEESS